MILPALGYVVLCAGFFYAWLRPQSGYAHYYVDNAHLMEGFEVGLAFLGLFLAVKMSKTDGKMERLTTLLGALVIAVGLLSIALWPRIDEDPFTAVPWVVVAVSHIVEAVYGGRDPKKQIRNAIIWLVVCLGVVAGSQLIRMPYLGLTPDVQSALWPQTPRTHHTSFAALVVLFALQAITAIVAARQSSQGDDTGHMPGS